MIDIEKTNRVERACKHYFPEVLQCTVDIDQVALKVGFQVAGDTWAWSRARDPGADLIVVPFVTLLTNMRRTLGKTFQLQAVKQAEFLTREVCYPPIAHALADLAVDAVIRTRPTIHGVAVNLKWKVLEYLADYSR